MPTPSPNRALSRTHGRFPRGGRGTKGTRWIAFAVIAVLYIMGQLFWFSPSLVGEDDEYPLLRSLEKKIPDAYFNNVPVRLKNVHETFSSSVHCVGETHDPVTSWKHRSCRYVHLCLDLTGKLAAETTAGGRGKGASEAKTPEFFLVTSPSEEQFQKRFRKDAAKSRYRYSSTELSGAIGGSHKNNNTAASTTISTDANYTPLDVALGGINPSWKAPPKPRVPYQHGIDKIRWKPRIHHQFPSNKYYELDSSVVLVPYHSFAAANVGHLLWDDFLPLYNLLNIFGFETNRNTWNRIGDGFQSTRQHLLLRVDTMPGLFGTCDLRSKKKEACQRNMERFLPLFGVDPTTFSTPTESKLTRTKNGERLSQTYPVCAKTAVAGLGWLTDHGIRNHGWMANREDHSLDVALAHNVGRGPELYAFRNFVLTNLGMRASPKPQTTPQFRILLSAHSSNHPDRSFGLEAQNSVLTKGFPDTELLVLELSSMPLLEQMSLVSNHAQPPESLGKHTIFVSACGGGSATAYFLPRGSSLILYYNEEGGVDYFDNERKTGNSALLDWDLMNNLGYLKVHWLPIGGMDDPEGLDALVALVQHEMDSVRNEII